MLHSFGVNGNHCRLTLRPLERTPPQLAFAQQGRLA
jgi:hypothetical protein